MPLEPTPPHPPDPKTTQRRTPVKSGIEESPPEANEPSKRRGHLIRSDHRKHWINHPKRGRHSQEKQTERRINRGWTWRTQVIIDWRVRTNGPNSYWLIIKQSGIAWRRTCWSKSGRKSSCIQSPLVKLGRLINLFSMETSITPPQNSSTHC